MSIIIYIYIGINIYIYISLFIGKHFYAAIWRECNLPKPYHFEHGYLRNRRRENPMLIQDIVAQKCRQYKRSHIQTSYDGKNAFLSIAPNNEVSELLKQRYRNATCSAHARDGQIDFTIIGSGALPGDRIAADLFRLTYGDYVREWVGGLEEGSEGKTLVAEHPITHEPINLMISVYADDIIKDTVLPERSEEDKVDDWVTNIETVINFSDDTLDKVLMPSGIAQNQTKKEHLAHLFGRGSNPATRMLYQNNTAIKGNFLVTMKYLGALVHRVGATQSETKERIAAGWKAWSILGSFWTSAAPWKARKFLFQALVLSAAVSGLEPKCLSETEYERINSFIVGRFRALLKGRAHYVVGGDGDDRKHVAITNIKVFKITRIVPIQIEMLARRLKWYQQIVRHPSESAAVVAALFGRFSNLGEGQSEADPKHFKLPSNATFHAQRWCQDFGMAAQVPEEPRLASVAAAVALNPLAPFIDSQVKSDFLEVDLSCVRVAFLMAEVFDSVLASAHRHYVDVDGESYPCPVVFEGAQCNRSFRTQRALETHLRRSEAGGHQWISVLNAMVCTNQCPVCGSVFSKVLDAQRHLTNAYLKGRCVIDRSVTSKWPREPESYECPMAQFGTCIYRATHLAQLQSHIASQHIPGSIEIELLLDPDVPVCHARAPASVRRDASGQRAPARRGRGRGHSLESEGARSTERRWRQRRGKGPDNPREVPRVLERRGRAALGQEGSASRRIRDEGRQRQGEGQRQGRAQGQGEGGEDRRDQTPAVEHAAEQDQLVAHERRGAAPHSLEARCENDQVLRQVLGAGAREQGTRVWSCFYSRRDALLDGAVRDGGFLDAQRGAPDDASQHAERHADPWGRLNLHQRIHVQGTARQNASDGSNHVSARQGVGTGGIRRTAQSDEHLTEGGASSARASGEEDPEDATRACWRKQKRKEVKAKAAAWLGTSGGNFSASPTLTSFAPALAGTSGTASQSASTCAPTLTGTSTASKSASISAPTTTGTCTASQAASTFAPALTGTCVASQSASIFAPASAGDGNAVASDSALTTPTAAGHARMAEPKTFACRDAFIRDIKERNAQQQTVSNPSQPKSAPPKASLGRGSLGDLLRRVDSRKGRYATERDGH